MRKLKAIRFHRDEDYELGLGDRVVGSPAMEAGWVYVLIEFDD